MSLINISNLSFAYDGGLDNIFENVNLQLDTKWRLGLVGRNGRGKTTLLNLLLGKFDYLGSITSPVKFEYFPYHVSDPEELTMEILREVSGAEDWQIERETNYLGFSADLLWYSFGLLSHGEQTKALLAAMFLREGSFLLIDEPTNHLDIEARRLLREYLARKSGFILVSHDRALLDGCVDHILSINRADIELVRGNFSSWQREKETRDRSETAENEKLKKDISRLRESAKRAANFSANAESEKYGTRNSGIKPDRGFLGAKAAKLMQRSKNIERRRSAMIDEKSSLMKNIDEIEELKISPLRHHSDRLLELKDVAISYDGREICSGVSFQLHAGERLVLRGKNGCGKSSIIKLITGESIDYSGEFSKSPRLIISQISQSANHLSGNISDYAEKRGLDLPLFLSILSKLGVPRVHFQTPMESLSEGQRKKILISASLCEQAHLYIWDEPLNFIDVQTRIQLEELIKKHCPTMILVEHDEAFCENVCTGIVNI